MGQYHIPVNLDKREYIHPHRMKYPGNDFGYGLKLMEQACSEGGTASALIILLAASNGRGGGDFHPDGFDDVVGRWAGDRIALVGDYAEPDDLDPEHHAETIYTLCGDAESIASQVEHIRKNLGEAREQEADELWGESLDVWEDRIIYLLTTGPFTDITERVTAALYEDRKAWA